MVEPASSKRKISNPTQCVCVCMHMDETCLLACLYMYGLLECRIDIRHVYASIESIWHECISIGINSNAIAQTDCIDGMLNKNTWKDKERRVLNAGPKMVATGTLF